MFLLRFYELLYCRNVRLANRKRTVACVPVETVELSAFHLVAFRTACLDLFNKRDLMQDSSIVRTTRERVHRRRQSTHPIELGAGGKI